MTRRTLHLTERRTRRAKLPAGEVAFLLAHARHAIEVVPDFEANVYRLTARGFVGFMCGPEIRYCISPKIPWPNVRLLCGLSHGQGEPTEPRGGLFAALATEFAERLDEVARAGLVCGYRAALAESRFLRGRLRTSEQMRDAAVRAFPDHFHIEDEVFDTDAPWNRVPRFVADLLARAALPHAVRDRVARAADALAPVPPATDFDTELLAARAEPRAAHYAPLLDVCEQLARGVRAADPNANTGSGFLFDLGRAFEQYLTCALARELGARRGWGVEAQPAFCLGPVELRPDVLVRRKGVPFAVLDAKWKAARPEPADLHQALAYSALCGTERVALVYPGTRTSRRVLAAPTGPARVTLYKLRVTGTADELATGAGRFARAVARG